MDKRIIKSKCKLMSAVIELTKDKDINDITISELCEEAVVDRATFYKYYTVPGDIFEEFVSLTLNIYVKKFDNLNDLLETQLNAIYDDRSPYVILNKSNKLFNLMYDKYINCSFFNGLDNLIVSFAVSGIVGMITRWIDSDCKKEKGIIRNNIVLFVDKLLK